MKQQIHMLVLHILLAICLAGYIAPVIAWSQTEDTARAALDAALHQAQTPTPDAQQPPTATTSAREQADPILRAVLESFRF